jgi:hypothetical protein
MNQTTEQTRKRSNLRLIPLLIVVPLSLVFAVVMVTMGFRSSIPPTGPPLAVFDIRSGEPFEQHLVSGGGHLEVWLEAECDDCSYPIEGNIRLVVADKTIESMEVSAGSSKRGGWEGGKKTMSKRSVLDAETPPAGVAMTLAGVLTVYGGRDYFTHKVKPSAPSPRVHLLRLTVTK